MGDRQVFFGDQHLDTSNAIDAAGNFDVVWKVPANIDGVLLPDLAPPGGCTAREQARQWEDAMGSWRQRQWTCPQGLAGADIAITYPLANPGLATIARFGFANVLREIGLPDEGLLVALFAFNMGIEIRQVIFAAGILGAWQLAVRLLPTAAQEPPLQRLAAYGLGITASVWLIERVTSA